MMVKLRVFTMNRYFSQVMAESAKHRQHELLPMIADDAVIENTNSSPHMCRYGRCDQIWSMSAEPM